MLLDPLLWVIAGILGYRMGKRAALIKYFLLCILFGGCYSLLVQTLLMHLREVPMPIGWAISGGVMRTGVFTLVSLMAFMFTRWGDRSESKESYSMKPPRNTCRRRRLSFSVIWLVCAVLMYLLLSRNYPPPKVDKSTIFHIGTFIGFSLGCALTALPFAIGIRWMWRKFRLLKKVINGTT